MINRCARWRWAALMLGATTQGCPIDKTVGHWEGDADAAAPLEPDTDDHDAGCASNGADADACAAGDSGFTSALGDSGLTSTPVDSGFTSAPSDSGFTGALGDSGFTSQVLTVTPGPTTSFFLDGSSFPAGDYTLEYLDGCWKSGVVAWTVNLGGEGYWVVAGRPEQRIAMAPGSVGTFAGLGAYATYEECVTANVGRSSLRIHFEGGPLGLKLESVDPLMPFVMVEGGESVGGRSPTFRLTCIGSCL